MLPLLLLALLALPLVLLLLLLLPPWAHGVQQRLQVRSSQLALLLPPLHLGMALPLRPTQHLAPVTSRGPAAAAAVGQLVGQQGQRDVLR